MHAADRPPLWGIPFAVKDNVDVQGFTTTAACKDFSYEPERSAPAVQALLNAGVDPKLQFCEPEPVKPPILYPCSLGNTTHAHRVHHTSCCVSCAVLCLSCHVLFSIHVLFLVHAYACNVYSQSSAAIEPHIVDA